MFDFLAASIGLLIALPVIAVLVIAIRIESDGPGIFSQLRVGRRGRPFWCYKLRSMRSDTPNVPTHQAAASHLTPLGRFLRRTKLDELPQLWNVVKGEMSLVGPRPCLPSQTELIREREMRGVLSLRPGITGLAQVQGIDMSQPARLADMDAKYLADQSIGADVRILLRTALKGEGRGDRIR